MPLSSHLENSNIGEQITPILQTGAPTPFLYTAPTNIFYIDADAGSDVDFLNFDGTTPARAFQTLFRVKQILRSYRVNPTADITIRFVASATPHEIDDFYFPRASVILEEYNGGAQRAILQPIGGPTAATLVIDVEEPLLFDGVQLQTETLSFVQSSNFSVKFQNCDITIDYFNIAKQTYVVFDSNTFFGATVGGTNSNGDDTWINITGSSTLLFENNTFDVGFGTKPSHRFITLLGGSRAFVNQVITQFSPLAAVNVFSLLQIQTGSTGTITRTGTSEYQLRTGGTLDSRHNYDNATSGLTAVNIQDALDELATSDEAQYIAIQVPALSTLPSTVGSNTLAIGESSLATGNNDIAIGRNVQTSGGSVNSVGIGRNISITGNDAVAIGLSANVTANDAVQIGDGTNATTQTLQFRSTTIANNTSIQATYQTTGAAPTSSPADGTLVLDHNGGTTTLYARANGAWVALASNP